MDFIKCDTLLFSGKCVYLHIDFDSILKPFVLVKLNALDIRDDLLNDIIAFAFNLNSFRVEF